MTELLTIERAMTLEPVGDGRTLCGRAVPYDVDSEVQDDPLGPRYYERFAFGAFAKNVRAGCHWVQLFAGHRGDRGERFLGNCTSAIERDDGLHLEFRLSQKADPQLADAARYGELTGWSVRATVVRSRELIQGVRRVVVREHCDLEHVAATKLPQYADAGVLVVRAHELIPAEATPELDRWRTKYGLPVIART